MAAIHTLAAPMSTKHCPFVQGALPLHEPPLQPLEKLEPLPLRSTELSARRKPTELVDQQGSALLKTAKDVYQLDGSAEKITWAGHIMSTTTPEPQLGPDRPTI